MICMKGLHFLRPAPTQSKTTAAGSFAERPKHLLDWEDELPSANPRKWLRKAVLWLSLLYLSCEQVDYINIQSCQFGSDQRS